MQPISVLGIFLYNALLHQVAFAVKSSKKGTFKHYEKNLIKFQKIKIVLQSHNASAAKYVVHNTSYDLSDEEIAALSNDFDLDIPTNTKINTIATEFELFSQNLLKYLSNIPENESKINTKLSNTCEKYSKVKVPYRHKKLF